ncbi:nuclear pore complex protein NUP160 isoform X2 [Momordica charantia]|uniref:Nuclear pore complex protein NUP160 isoform X2 n=1 Tax=Momordica charantia TaxID=3673 RepID=A0A6J1DQV6_MOMCH|nr:nuclear pore complex protein NUP160 isoform X2 [Momordica charantia]
MNPTRRENMGRRVPLAGMETSIMATHAVEFIDVSVPSPSFRDGAVASQATTSLTEDHASCVVVGDPPTHLIWRIRKILPRALEFFEFSTANEFRRVGLRISFPDTLHPAVFVCKNEISPSSLHPLLVYAVTLSGVAYCLKLRNISSYISCSDIPLDEVVELDLQTDPNCKPVTSVSAIAGCLVIGRNDGSVSCFKLGLLDQHTPGFEHELRDDSGINRLLGFISRVKLVGAVLDMVISQVYGRQFLFVLHFNGVLRVWDLSCHSRVLNHSMNIATMAGAKFARLWVGQASIDMSTIPLAILYKHPDLSLETIYIYSLRFSWGDKVSLMLEPSTHNIPLDQGGCLDVKLASDKIWVLKDNALIFLDLLPSDDRVGEAQCYALQEEFIADQLFQSVDYSSDAILWVTHSIFSSTKDEVVPFISTIFIRRLLQPGVYNEMALRATLLEYSRHWTDSNFRSMTSDELKQEIISLIEEEGATATPVSIYLWWKNFCTHYIHHWCTENAPSFLLVDNSSAAVGLVRRNSVSLFRCLDNVEQLLDGFSGELDELGGPDIDWIDNDSDSELLLEVLRCVISISRRLGKTALAIFYESLMSKPIIPFGEVVCRILKILENGYSSSVVMIKRSDLEVGCSSERELTDKKNLRKFSIEMMLSLHALCKKGATWGRVLDVIESFLKYFVPRKMAHKVEAQTSSDANTSILVQATTQIAKVMLESALDVLLFLNYMVSISGQIDLLHDDTSRIKLELIPMIEEIICEWHIIHFLAITPSESAAIEDFSSQLSLLQIDTNGGKEIWKGKLGKCDFTLASLLLLKFHSSAQGPIYLSSKCLLNPQEIVIATQNFTSWIIWGNSREPSAFLNTSTELALILLRHGQYDAVEYLLSVVKAQSQNEKTSQCMQDADGGWCVMHHLLGCCQLAQAHYKLHGVLKERKVHEAICSFFRASSGNRSSQALQSLPHEVGFSSFETTGCLSSITWRFHYYQWAMQLFEQYNISKGAFEFVLAALELVEEAVTPKDNNCGRLPFNESAISIQGRLWANVFKFALDLHQFYDAYCAIISNPEEESKYLCLRRFIIVIYECHDIKILCCGELPFIGLAEKVEQELVWKAERSDLLSKPSLYKLLYAFEIHRHNWQKAASYIYLYSVRLRMELALGDNQFSSSLLLERLNGLSAAINALHLVHPDFAWIESPVERDDIQSKHYPSKKAKRTVDEQCTVANDDIRPQKQNSFIDMKQLENEFVLTSSEYLLSVANIKWPFTGIHEAPSELVDLLVQNNFYDMAFTIVLRFWRDSELKRELERVFSAMSLKCCPSRLSSSGLRNDPRTNSLLLISPNGGDDVHGSLDVIPVRQHLNGYGHWETLELYLEKYKSFNPRLPFIVAETLLRTDSKMELPLWLVLMFKDRRRAKSWGMTGEESNPASLFRLYVDYGRYTEATHLLLECMESFASLPPADIINRKRPFSVCFPYTAIQYLWCRIDELVRSGHMVDICEKLRNLLRGALLNHLKLLKVESDDVLSAIV